MKHFAAGPQRPPDYALRARRSGPRHAAAPADGEPRLVIGVLVLLAVVLLAAVAVPGSGGAQQARLTALVQPEPLWSARLTQLYAVRAEAFSSGDTQLLREVYTIDSPQLRADLDTVEILLVQQRSVVGFAPTLLEVVSVSQSTTSAVVVVRDEIEPFAVVDLSGTRLPVAGRAATESTLTLQYVDGDWLIATAERATG